MSSVQSLVQFEKAGTRGVAAIGDDSVVRAISAAETTLGLAEIALRDGTTLAKLAGESAGAEVDLSSVRLLCPIDHPDTAHLLVTGTGLTHLGSAEGRDKMHKAAAAGQATDSMRMFLMGLEGGKPTAGETGVQPEWFYKGDGSTLVGPGEPLLRPSFAMDGGEEPEIAGIYLLDGVGRPVRLGFCLGNEFSDHVTERENYLWLAHSKLRSAALGPELRLGELPQEVHGTSRILRGGAVAWERPFASGEALMSHTIANLEHHHFKYGLFRRPGDLHVHFFGTATLSFSDGFEVRDGDEFEISSELFTLPARNPVRFDDGQDGTEVVSI